MLIFVDYLHRKSRLGSLRGRTREDGGSDGVTVQCRLPGPRLTALAAAGELHYVGRQGMGDETKLEFPAPLITEIANGRCLPFVGAGFSKNAWIPRGHTMPDWAELASILARDARMSIDATPPGIAERYEQRFGRVQLVETVREALLPDKARPGRAHQSFVQLPFDTVYTTNFDLLLEDAYAQAHRPFRSLVGELQLPFHAGQMASSIVKMHGDIRHQEHIIITQRDYDQFMDRYPVIATHLSAMLITRTPLFIGYSLSDPDFSHIRRVVRSRLGAFERMAYVVQFDVDSERVEKALADKVHIISLETSPGASRDETLASFFTTIQAQLDKRAGVFLRNSRPDVFEEIGEDVIEKAVEIRESYSVIEATSRLCFLIMPFGQKFDEVYRNLVEPAVRESGLTVLRADEIASHGFVMEQIRSAIQQSRLCIADVTSDNPNVLYEIGFAQALGKPIVLIAEEGSQLPFDVAHQRVVFYGGPQARGQYVLQKAISSALSHDRFNEALRLLELKEYRGAVAAASVVLEQRLREVMVKSPQGQLGRMTLGQLVELAKKRRIVRGHLGGKLSALLKLRNEAVHEPRIPTYEEALFVVNMVREFMEGTADEGDDSDLGAAN